MPSERRQSWVSMTRWQWFGIRQNVWTRQSCRSTAWANSVRKRRYSSGARKVAVFATPRVVT